MKQYEQDKPPFGTEAERLVWNSDRMAALLAGMGSMRPVGSTGLLGLDELLGGGLAPGVIVLSGEPGAGKSSFALQLADFVARFGTRRVLYLSLEMAASQLVAKSLTRLSAELHPRPVQLREIPALLGRSEAAGERAEQLHEAIDVYSREIAPCISTQDGIAVVSGVEALYEMLPKNELPPVLVLDYAQLIAREEGDAGATDIQLISATMRGLCSLSKRYGVPVLCLSSQNRGKRGSSSLDSLAGCSELEYSATVVMFLSVDGGSQEQRLENAAFSPRPVTLTVAKNRFGAVGELPLWFFPGQSRFIERVES